VKAIERRVARMESTLPPPGVEYPEVVFVVAMARLPDGEIGGEAMFAMLTGGLGNVSREEGETEADFERRVERIRLQRKATLHEQSTKEKHHHGNA